MREKDWPVVVLLLLLVFALRVWGLTATSLWYDETFVLYHAQRGVADAFAGLLREDNAIPLHGVLLALWVGVAGSGEFAARYLSVLLGVLAAPLLWQVAASLQGVRPRRAAGWGTVLAYATLPIFVYYTQEVRMYALVIPLAAAFAWVSWRITQHQRGTWLYVILGIAMLLAHLYAGLLWVTLWLWGTATLLLKETTRDQTLAPPLSNTRQRFRLSPTLWAWQRANLLLLLAALPITFWAMWRTQIDATATSAVPAETLRWIPALFGVGQYLQEPWSAVFVIAAGAALLAAGAHWLLFRRQAAALWMVLLLSIPLSLLLGATLIKAKWSERYLLPSFGLAVVVGAGAGWETLLCKRPPLGKSSRFRRPVSRILGGALLLIWLGLAFPALARQAKGTWAIGIRDEWHPRPDFRGVARYIAEHDAATDAIVVVGGYAAHTLDYYYDGPARVFGLPSDARVLDTRTPIDLRALSTLEHESQGATRLWLVLWQESLSDPTGLIQSVLVDRCERLPVGAKFTNVGVLLFDLAQCRPLDFLATPPQLAEAVFVAPIRWIGYHAAYNAPVWEVDLWWESTGPLEETYTVFVHLLDADGNTVAHHDHIAGADAFPSGHWPAGTRIRDRFFLEVPGGACDNGCTVRFGLYTAQGRLPLRDGGDFLTIQIGE
ncbi:MAG: glycosyltransferase family 39 protein [Anaerolineae bacterium]|nr:glycosyltransferase family 39 protein [Anaerolineae bacterium]